MVAKEDAKLPELPKEFPHIFTEVVFQLIPEANYDDLVYLSQLLKLNKREAIYGPLTDALRKFQWTKLAGIGAITVEKDVAKDIENGIEHEGGGIIYFNPTAQVQHAKTVFEFIVHTKSALDTIAVFLTELLSIPATGGQRDFKHRRFREQIIQKDAVIGRYIKTLEQWFRDIQDRRDEWIHRTSTRIFIAFPPGELGLFPISKIVTEDYKLGDVPPTRECYWTTQEFIELNLVKLVFFLNSIVARCIEIERARIGTPPPYPQKSEHPITAFPLQVMKNMKLKGIRMRF